MPDYSMVNKSATDETLTYEKSTADAKLVCKDYAQSKFPIEIELLDCRMQLRPHLFAFKKFARQFWHEML